MHIFSGDKSIYGRYAAIIKKYSQTSDSDAGEWKITNGENAAQSEKIFGTYVDCLYAAASIGLAKNLKIKDDAIDRKVKANILASAWTKRQVDFEYLYKLMILTDKDLELDKDQRVKKACSDIPESQANNEFNYFLQYAYGGLVEMDKMLSNVQDYTSFTNYVSSVWADLNDEDDE